MPFKLIFIEFIHVKILILIDFRTKLLLKYPVFPKSHGELVGD